MSDEAKTADFFETVHYQMDGNERRAYVGVAAVGGRRELGAFMVLAPDVEGLQAVWDLLMPEVALEPMKIEEAMIVKGEYGRRLLAGTTN